MEKKIQRESEEEETLIKNSRRLEKREGIER
jgi:hypothetical protein